MDPVFGPQINSQVIQASPHGLYTNRIMCLQQQFVKAILKDAHQLVYIIFHTDRISAFCLYQPYFGDKHTILVGLNFRGNTECSRVNMVNMLLMPFLTCGKIQLVALVCMDWVSRPIYFWVGVCHQLFIMKIGQTIRQILT